MLTEQPILITSIKCTESLGITKNHFVTFEGTLGTEGEKSLGVCNADTAVNEMMPVAAKGIALVITGGIINYGNPVQSFDNGVAILQTTGPLEGYAMDSAASAGQIIRILLA